MHTSSLCYIVLPLQDPSEAESKAKCAVRSLAMRPGPLDQRLELVPLPQAERFALGVSLAGVDEGFGRGDRRDERVRGEARVPAVQGEGAVCGR